jgi:O-antigen/teichoic acid export membrane protein
LSKRDALYNIAGPIIQVAIAFVSVPVYLKLLGIDRYGAVIAMLLLTTYLGLFDAGASKAAAYRLAATESPERRFSAFVTTLTIAVVLSCLVGGLAFLPMRDVFVPQFFYTSDKFLNREILSAVAFAFLAVPFATVATVVTGALDGQGRFAVSNLLGIAMGAGQLLGPITCVVLFGPSVAVAFAGILLARIVVALSGLAVVLGGGTTRYSALFNRGEARIALRFGGWMTVTNLVSPALNSADQIILSATAGVTALPHYAIPLGAVSRAAIIPGGIARALFPHLASSLQNHAISAVMTPLCLLGFIWLDVAFRLWLGSSLEPSMPLIGQIGLFGMWALSFAQVPAVLAQAQGRAHLIALVHVGEVVPYLVAMYLAASKYGLIGAACVWTARCYIDAVLHVAVVGTRVSIARDVLPFVVGAAMIWGTLVWGGNASSFPTKVLLSILCLLISAPSSLSLLFSTGRLSRHFSARFRIGEDTDRYPRGS